MPYCQKSDKERMRNIIEHLTTIQLRPPTHRGRYPNDDLLKGAQSPSRPNPSESFNQYYEKYQTQANGIAGYEAVTFMF